MPGLADGLFRYWKTLPGNGNLSPECGLSQQSLVGLAPVFEVVNNRISSTSCDYPFDFLAAIIDLLVFSICWNERKVSRCKLLSFRTIRSTNNGTVTARSVYDSICSLHQILLRRCTSSVKGSEDEGL
jgi:hypothetical protein